MINSDTQLLLDNPAVPKIQLVEKCRRVLEQKARIKVLRGGRGGGRSWSVARYLLGKTIGRSLRILCTREIQNTIRDSVYKLLCDQIYLLKLEDYFVIRQDIIQGVFGSEFIFRGLRQNIEEIKSMEGIDICWGEEAAKLSQNSLDILTPTIRKEDSEIIFTFNPDSDKDPVYTHYVLQTPPDCVGDIMNWRDNPWFPEVLKKEMEYCKRVDFDKYEHVWEGKTKGYAEDCIFKGKVVVQEFVAPEGIQFYYGGDFGFSTDAAWVGRCYILDEKDEQGLPVKNLYIDYEAYGVGIEILQLEAFYRLVPDIYKWKIRADSARPDTISHLHNLGFDIEGAEKGKGSVEDGIEFIRSFYRIYIHPRCKGAIDNFENYRWKRDRLTDTILPIPVDASNHAPDGIRYALEPYVKNKISCWDVI